MRRWRFSADWLEESRSPPTTDYYPLPDADLAPPPASPRDPIVDRKLGLEGRSAQGREAGRRWLASAYNTTPEDFAAGRALLADQLQERGKSPESFPNALATMWTWVTESRAEADRVLTQVLAPLLSRDPEELRAQVCVGSAEHCAELLSRYADAGCQRV